jgi:uncharacterized coiled-coil DUF342 family protein
VSKQQKIQKIEELTQRLVVLKEQKSRLDAEARGLKEKRDKLNEQFMSARTEILELKNERNKLNETVKELKRQRSETNMGIQEKIGEIRRLRQEIEALTRKKPSKSLQTLQREVENIEWMIQTTSLSLQEEKELVERVKQLEAQLNIHKKLSQLNQKRLELQAELKAFGAQSKLYHEKLVETAQKSQGIHEKMLEKVGEAKKLKLEADSLHQIFIQVKEKKRSIQGEMAEILNQMKKLKEEVRGEEEREKKKREEALLEKLESQAREKLKRGEKLTWEEFKIITEKGMVAQD